MQLWWKVCVTWILMSLTWYINMHFSGWCLLLQEAIFPFGVGGKACSHDFCSSGMQHRPNPDTWLLLEGTTEQLCKIYNHVLLVSSFHISIHEVLIFKLNTYWCHYLFLWQLKFIGIGGWPPCFSSMSMIYLGEQWHSSTGRQLCGTHMLELALT